MAVRYNKLWKQLIDKNMSKTHLIKATGISTNAMAKMGKNEEVRLETLAKICTLFGCSLDDIVEVLPELAKTSAEKE